MLGRPSSTHGSTKTLLLTKSPSCVCFACIIDTVYSFYFFYTWFGIGFLSSIVIVNYRTITYGNQFCFIHVSQNFIVLLFGPWFS